MKNEFIEKRIEGILSQVITNVINNPAHQAKDGEGYEQHVERVADMVGEELKRAGRPYDLREMDLSIARKIVGKVSEVVTEQDGTFDGAPEVVKAAIPGLILALSILDDDGDRELVADDLARRHIESAFGKLVCPCCFDKISNRDKFYMLDAVKAGAGIVSGKMGLAKIDVKNNGTFFEVAINGLVVPYVSEIEIMGIFSDLIEKLEACMNNELPEGMSKGIYEIRESILASKKKAIA